MISNKFKFDEYLYAETIANEGFRSVNKKPELKMLAKYYRDVWRLTEPQVRKKLIEFCQKHVLDFDIAIHFKLINTAISSSKKGSALICVPWICIYKNEVNEIANIPLTHSHKKLFFTLVVYDRLIRKSIKMKTGTEPNVVYYRGGKRNYAKLKGFANLKKDFDINKDGIPELAKLGFVKILDRGGIEIKPFPENPEQSEVMINVKDYDNIGLYYDCAAGNKKIKMCVHCNKPFYQKSNRQKYCKPCAAEDEKDKKSWFSAITYRFKKEKRA